MMNKSQEAVVVFMTAPDQKEAEQLAEILINRRLAACVQILPPMISVYHWQGKIERSTETLILAKTSLDKFAALDEAVREAHSYDVPEIMAVPATAVSAPYLEWLLNSEKLNSEK